MKMNTINISLKPELLNQIDQIAQEESRSELIREAAKIYIEKKNRWKSVFEFGDKFAETNNIKEEDIIKEIKKHRKSRFFD